MRLNATAAGEEHVSEEHENVERNSKVSCNEVLIVKSGVLGVDEDVEVLCQTDKNDKGQADDSTPESLRGDIRHGTIGDVLGAASTQEEEVGDKDGNPSQDTKDGNKINKVTKDLIMVLEKTLLRIMRIVRETYHCTVGRSVHKCKTANR